MAPAIHIGRKSPRMDLKKPVVRPAQRLHRQLRHSTERRLPEQDIWKSQGGKLEGPCPAGVEDMDEGYGTPDEDKTAGLTPAKMTVNAIKDWLTENGHENVVWDLTQAKAKKPR